MKILHQFSVQQHRLGADARAAGLQILRANFRHEFLQRARELRFGKGAANFITAHAWILDEKFPQAGVKKRFGEIAQVYGSPLVAFARKGEHGIRSGLNAAVDQPREMDAKKRKLGVEHGINQMADQKLPLLFDLKILTAKRDDFRRRRLTRRPVGADRKS